MVRVAFLHPDLGIGGAERLVVDAALALQKRGHKVHIFTAHHDRKRCFPETRNGTIGVTTVGNWLPRHFFEKGHALCAFVKMVYVALYVSLMSFLCCWRYEVFICDQVSTCVPFLRYCTRAKVVFYCHYPDQLLTSTYRLENLRKVYRTVLNWIEERTTGMAHEILCNSFFTKEAFERTFRSLYHRKVNVVYPSIDFSSFDINPPPIPKLIKQSPKRMIFLTINRYERKKNMRLAIESIQKMFRKYTIYDRMDAHLIIAGGYDERLRENVEYYNELRLCAQQCQVSRIVYFFKNVTHEEKVALLRHCDVFLYTPSKEHFGIGPVEAMYMGKPVIAINDGGPVETVLHGETGWLTEADPDRFSNRMLNFVRHPEDMKKFGEAGRKRVEEVFSQEKFVNSFDDLVNRLATGPDDDY